MKTEGGLGVSQVLLVFFLWINWLFGISGVLSLKHLKDVLDTLKCFMGILEPVVSKIKGPSLAASLDFIKVLVNSSNKLLIIFLNFLIFGIVFYIDQCLTYRVKSFLFGELFYFVLREKYSVWQEVPLVSLLDVASFITNSPWISRDISRFSPRLQKGLVLILFFKLLLISIALFYCILYRFRFLML